jgi:hypothetical protein
MTFDNLDSGDYTIQVLRNGDQATAADFTVST